ncbi:MAG: hypothetical protein B6244_01935 [Candidatus Cloacimonetes bacterium 4572_55]|nr:MAG: hypothetical protein B6244_01935 [Candidatus Cloacimonetes bacterium 4572_55]
MRKLVIILFLVTIVIATVKVGYADPETSFSDVDWSVFFSNILGESAARDYNVPPTFEEVILIPPTPVADYFQQIEVRTSDNAAHVSVKATTDSGESWSYITLARQEPGYWSGGLGIFSEGTEITFFLSAEDSLGQKTIEAFPVSGWLPESQEWSSIFSDENDADIDDLDIQNGYVGYDADYFYARFDVRGDISGGSILPWNFKVYTYVAGIKNVGTNVQYGLVYVPLAGNFGQDDIALRIEPNGDTVPNASEQYNEDDDELSMRCLFEPMGENSDNYYRLTYATAYVRNLDMDIEGVDTTAYCHFYPRAHTYSVLSNQPPIAVTDSSINAFRGQLVELDGSGSFDPDGSPQPLTYMWLQTQGEPVELNDPTAMNPTFQVPNAPGQFRFELTVNDGALESDPAETIVNVNNAPPTISEIPPINFDEDTIFYFDARPYIDDPDDPEESLTIAWDENDLLLIESVGDSIYRLTTHAADQNGTTQAVCRVSDPYGGAALASVDATVNPVNDPPQISDIPDFDFYLGDTLTVDLSGYVADVDHGVDEVVWSWSGAQNLTVMTLSQSTIQIRVRQVQWTGVEPITFTATDPDDAMDMTVVQFTVTRRDGDPTGDGLITVEDIDWLAEELLTFDTFVFGDIFAAADLDDDNILSIRDLVLMVNLIQSAER